MNSRIQEPIPVVAAVLQRGERFLVAQRPAGKHLALKWEFPGGKVEAGEAPEAALRREILEELGAEIEVGRALQSFTHDYGRVHIRLLPFLCSLSPGSPEPAAHEHAALRWVSIQELQTLDLAEADLPVLRELSGRAGPL